ncbi:MAG TPA: hypothetical protein VED20_10705 [Streptosporangiaceae bacterium]|nr:hypothetical protein [Streptosporangiaceae bacterium]
MSITVSRPSRRAKPAISRSSPTRISGLVIVSTRNALVCPVHAAVQVSGRCTSTKLYRQPRSSAWWVRKSWVPP